jgi:proline racemase
MTRWLRQLTAVDSHTEGMPTRVVTSGAPTFPGETMAARRTWFIENSDDLRRFLVDEPRGHAAMSGAILQPPTRPDADWGVLFVEVSGCLPMCGHGTIGVATVLVHAGLVTVTEPVTTIRLDTPAGLVVAEVEVRDGVARSVSITNVPSYVDALDQVVEVPGLGQVRYDMAYGGNFYAIVDADELGLKIDPDQAPHLMQTGMAIMAAIDEAASPVHVTDPQIRGCHHVALTRLEAPLLARHAMVISPGWFVRSPCGTGTSARLAQLVARGLVNDDDTFTNVSLIGTRFTARVAGRTRVGDGDAIVPVITGRAWITGTAEYVHDPDDPFPAGFVLPTWSAP